MASKRKQKDIDHPLEIFLNQASAANHICVICQSVYIQATSIGCKQDHTFCRKCLFDYFKDSKYKSCPSCRQDKLTKKHLRQCKNIDRILNSEKVMCLLEYQKQFEEKIDDSIQCKWTGELINLSKHIIDECPLYMKVCKHCKKTFKRYEEKNHTKQCKVKCTYWSLGCKNKIKRSEIKKHMDKYNMQHLQMQVNFLMQQNKDKDQKIDKLQSKVKSLEKDNKELMKRTVHNNKWIKEMDNKVKNNNGKNKNNNKKPWGNNDNDDGLWQFQ
eukprot:72698_1